MLRRRMVLHARPDSTLGADGGWRLWYLAALVLFSVDVSRERLKRSSLLARLRLFPGTGGIVLSRLLDRSRIHGCIRRRKKLESRL